MPTRKGVGYSALLGFLRRERDLDPNMSFSDLVALHLRTMRVRFGQSGPRSGSLGVLSLALARGSAG